MLPGNIHGSRRDMRDGQLNPQLPGNLSRQRASPHHASNLDPRTSNFPSSNNPPSNTPNPLNTPLVAAPTPPNARQDAAAHRILNPNLVPHPPRRPPRHHHAHPVRRPLPQVRRLLAAGPRPVPRPRGPARRRRRCRAREHRRRGAPRPQDEGRGRAVEEGRGGGRRRRRDGG